MVQIYTGPLRMATGKRSVASRAEKWALPARQARSRATRERIMLTAEKIFAEQGYAGAKLSDIAQAAGCSVGAVYFRFKDKEALFQAIAETFAESTQATFTRFLADAQDLATDALICDFVVRTSRTMRQHRGLFRAIIERGFDDPDAVAVMFAFRDAVAQALENMLRSRAGSRRAPRLTEAVRVMTQMVYGFLLIGVLNPRAPTKSNDQAAIRELATAAGTYLKTVLNP